MRSTQTTHRQRRRVDTTQMLIGMILLSVGFAFILGMSINGSPERQALALEEAAAVLPWRIASKVTGYIFGGIVFKVTLYILGSFGGYFVLRVGLNWIDLRSRQVHAHDGIFPLVRLNDSTLYDANRAMGEHPLITVAALEVQRTAALKADKIMVKMGDNKALQQANLPALPQPVFSWPSRVPLRGLLDGQASLNDLVLGVTLDANGQSHVVKGTMPDLVHVAVGGSSGWGKSVFLQMLAYQLVTAIERPDLCMIDLEGVTLNAFAQSERLLYPIADSEQTALALLLALNGELERRKELFNQHPGIDRLDRYNAIASAPLKPIITVIDEATALLDNKDIEAHLKELTLRARKYGLWLVLAGQDWKASSLDTAIRNQLSTRVQFKALNASQSRVLIGEGDAKDLDAVGRALAVLPGKPMMELQAPYVNAGMILEAVKGNGAQRALDLAAVEVGQAIEDDLTLSEPERVKLLDAQGASRSEIERRVFGFAGGSAYRKVKDILSE